MSQLTVILPVYNASLFLAKSIKSILNQSFKDFTLLIINDGSTDGSLQIAKSFMSKDSRVKIVSHENRGLVSALNEGIELSQTEYIARMDADDIACRNRLKKQLAFMQQNPEVAFCGTAASMFYSSFPLIRKRVIYPSQKDQLKLSLLFRCPFVHPSVVIRRDFLLNNNLRYDDSFKGMEDYELWSRAVRSGECANLKNILLNYRLHAKSVTQQSNSDMQKSEERLNRYRRLLTSYFSYLQIPVTEKEMNVHPQSDVKSLYGSSSIYAMTSRFEGLPMVLIEAASCGLPIVSFDCPYGPSSVVVHNENGYLVDNNNVLQFSEYLSKLMESEQLRKQMGEKSFVCAKDFSTESVSKKWFALFNELK